MKQRESGLPFDDFRNLVKTLPPANVEAARHTSQAFDGLDDRNANIQSLCEWYSRWSGRSPVVHRPLMTLFCGTHALNNRLDGGENVEWLLANVSEVAEGGSAINRLCHQQDMGLKLFDLALQIPVEDISVEAALDEKSCAGTIAFGMEAIAGGSDLLAVCAIENQITPSVAAILSVLKGMEFHAGAMASAEYADAVASSIELAKAHKSNPLEVLRRLGGRETAAICGAILAARTEHIPTIVGGTTALAALAVLNSLDPNAISHCVLASNFEDAGLRNIVKELEVPVLLDKPFSNHFGAEVAMGVGMLVSAFKHFPVADQAALS